MIIKKTKNDQETHEVFKTCLTVSFLKHEMLCDWDQCGYAGEPSQHACLIVPQKRYSMSAKEDDTLKRQPMLSKLIDMNVS